MIGRFLRRLAGSAGRRRAEAELDEEVRFHLAMETEENLRRGMAPAEARRAAERRFGRQVDSVDAAHGERGLPWLEDAAGDARLALRTIRRAPAFSAAIILLMALGIGANAAVFTVVDGVLVRGLPYPDPDELVSLVRFGPGGSGTGHDGPVVEELRRTSDAAQTVAAIGAPAGLNLVDGELALYVRALPASHEYTRVMGLAPARGRAFAAADEKTGAAPVAIASPELARRLGGDVLGRRVTLGGKPHEIVGVLAEGPPTYPRAELLVPLRLGFEAGGTNFEVLARVRDGQGPAATRLGGATAALHQAGALDRATSLRWTDLHQTLSEVRRPTLLLLFGAVGLVLLVACANVGGLLLIKAQRRSAELAVRAALGAGPGRLVRQLLTEGMIYAVAGGLLGLLAAHWALSLLLHLAPPDLADWNIGIDGRVLLFGLLLTGLTGLACGIAPALRAGRVDLRQAVGGGASGVASSALRVRWRRMLLVGQLALCTLLLLGAGLLTRTLLSLRAVDPGFSPGSVLALTIAPELDSAMPLQTFYARALEQVARVPGVRRAVLAGAVPGRRGLNMPVKVPSGLTSAGWRYVSPGYFEMLRVPVESGRALDARDSAAAQPVVVVNRAFARAHFPGRDPVGLTLELYKTSPEYDDPPRTIVGVVGDTRDEGPRDPPEPRLYVPLAQVHPGIFLIVHRWFDACWLIDTDMSPAIAADRVGGVLRSLQPGLPFSEVTRLEEVVAGHVASERFLTWLLAAFALVALCIGGAGIYGVTAHSVSQRSREIAIRMALGASPARIVRGIVGEGLVVAAAGVLLGLLAAWPLGSLLSRFLFGASSFDPVTSGLVALVLLAAAALASLAPAARAARIDPVSNLRQG